MMTVGYGDIVPQNSIEIGYTLITVFCGCIVFGYNLNKIANIFQDMNKEEKKMQDNITKINKFMDSKQINKNLQMRIRAYLKFIWENKREKLNNELLNIIDSLSDSLKNELYCEGYGNIIRKYSLFADNFSENFLEALVRYMEEKNFMKDDIIFKENENFNQNLYFIMTGKIDVFHVIADEKNPLILKKLKDKDSFGEYSFFTGLNNIYSTKASEYTKLYKISQTSFQEVLSKFPQDYEKYCELRDKIILYNNYTDLNIRCLICNKKDHLSNNCNLIHYIPNKPIIFLRHLYSRDQERKPSFKRKRKKCNSLIMKKSIIDKTRKFQFVLPCDSDENITDSNNSFSCDSLPEPENLNSLNKQNSLIIDKIENNNSNPDIMLKMKNNLESEIPKISRILTLEDKSSSVMKMKLESKEINDKMRNYSSFLRPSDPDTELVKNFICYFPESNINNFINKFKKLRKMLKKEAKKQKLLTPHLSLPKYRKSGYGLFIENLKGEDSKTSKSERDSPIIRNIIPLVQESQGITNLTPSNKGFFSIKEIQKPLNFLELVKEMRQSKTTKK